MVNIIRTTSELYTVITPELIKRRDYFITADIRVGEFNHLIIKNKTVDGIDRFTIVDIELKKEYRGNGMFKEFIVYLELLKVPLMVDKILNVKLIPFLSNRGWVKYEYGTWNTTISMIYH